MTSRTQKSKSAHAHNAHAFAKRDSFIKAKNQKPIRKGVFFRFASAAAEAAGSPVAFCLALICVLVWASTGPMFGYSDTWQIVINTATTIITFLLVFLIQNSQNRDTRALQIKLDELIRVTEGAHTVLLDLENLSNSELCELGKRYRSIAEESRKRLRHGEMDTHIPDVKID